MVVYKLHYFDLRARAEPARMLFALAGQEYEDRRHTTEEWMNGGKARSQIGVLPMLEIDGVQLSQSVAIWRFLARRFGFVGKTDLDQAKEDQAVDVCGDVLTGVQKAFKAEDKPAAIQQYKDEVMDGALTNLNKQLQSSGYTTGKSLSWADLAIYCTLGWYDVLGAEIDMKKFANLANLKKNVESNDKIAAWIKKRPQNPM